MVKAAVDSLIKWAASGIELPTVKEKETNLEKEAELKR